MSETKYLKIGEKKMLFWLHCLCSYMSEEVYHKCRQTKKDSCILQ